MAKRQFFGIKYPFTTNDYQNFFVKVEYKATYPRRNFIIKFLPLLNIYSALMTLRRGKE